MAQTSLLPPITAVRVVWARTGSFSNDKRSGQSAAMSIGGAGSVTVAQYFKLSGIQLWGVGLALAGLGYIINLLIVRKMRRSKQMLYVGQDYERGLYYDNI
mgnify:FL=1